METSQPSPVVSVWLDESGSRFQNSFVPKTYDIFSFDTYFITLKIHYEIKLYLETPFGDHGIY